MTQLSLACGPRDATPRIVFNGPLIKNRLYLSEGTEYAIKKRPVQTLEYPNKETKTEYINSFTQLAARTRQGEGLLKRWPPRAGEQVLT